MTEKKGKWNCPHGCNQEKHMEKHGSYCKHLEAIIGPSGGPPHRRHVVTNNMDTFGNTESPEKRMLREELERSLGEEEEEEPLDDEERMLRKLRAMGLPEKKAAVVTYRTVRGSTFQEIADELGYSRAQAAIRAYNDALDALRARGKKNEKE